MHLSISELNLYAQRAAFAIGLPWGYGAAFGQALTRLAAFGHDPAPAAATALTNIASGEAGPIAVAHTDFVKQSHWTPVSQQVASAIWAGPLVNDWLALNAHIDSSLQIETIDLPLLLAAYLPSSLVTVEPGSTSLALANRDINVEHLTVVVKPGGNLTAPNRSKPRDGVEVNTRDWRVIEKFFTRCNIPTNASSRQWGAGAGCIDLG